MHLLTRWQGPGCQAGGQCVHGKGPKAVAARSAKHPFLCQKQTELQAAWEPAPSCPASLSAAPWEAGFSPEVPFGIADSLPAVVDSSSPPCPGPELPSRQASQAVQGSPFLLGANLAHGALQK